jgi:hypothetical protein
MCPHIFAPLTLNRKEYTHEWDEAVCPSERRNLGYFWMTFILLTHEPNANPKVAAYPERERNHDSLDSVPVGRSSRFFLYLRYYSATWGSKDAVSGWCLKLVVSRRLLSQATTHGQMESYLQSYYADPTFQQGAPLWHFYKFTSIEHFLSFVPLSLSQKKIDKVATIYDG